MIWMSMLMVTNVLYITADDNTSILICFIYYILLNLSVLGLCLRINDSGLFAWISLTALSRTYFSIIVIHIGCFVADLLSIIVIHIGCFVADLF